ncbi:glycosyl hydrolase 108 family protein [Methylobacter sp. Wu1]|uniref:glycoside hydrolase family 108 protein n=1 Tax=Methylobacter sp. Wu1 TaxID=3119359 RepID=UPI002F955D82
MSKTVDEMISDIIRREGGYSNNKNDHGSYTKFGVTLKTLNSWRGKECSQEDVKALTKQEAAEIYKAEYFYKPKIDKLPQSLQPVVFDMAVNMGPKQAIKTLQFVLFQNTENSDGFIGGVTIKKARDVLELIGARMLILQIIEARIKYYRGIVKRDPSQAVFLAGWENRAREFLA